MTLCALLRHFHFISVQYVLWMDWIIAVTHVQESIWSQSGARNLNRKRAQGWHMLKSLVQVSGTRNWHQIEHSSIQCLFLVPEKNFARKHDRRLKNLRKFLVQVSGARFSSMCHPYNSEKVQKAFIRLAYWQFAVISTQTWRGLWHLFVTGELITAVIERSRPGTGLVTATWSIAAVNGRPAHLRFQNTTGSVMFHQVRRYYTPVDCLIIQYTPVN